MKRRGAYGRYKALLADKNLLDAWYAFENDRTREALLEWCKENGVDFNTVLLSEPGTDNDKSTKTP